MMKISAISSFAVYPGWRKKLIFVKVETNDGLTGWGEAYSQYDRDRAVTAHIEELGRYAVGRNPFDIKHFTLMAFDDYAQRRGSLELFSAVSGIEQALWDIIGKSCGQPVYNLLGGRCRDKIRVYANGWSYGMKSPSDYARAAEQVVKQGFTAVKFDPLPTPWRTYIPEEHERHAIAVVKAVRSAVGPQVDILIEQHRRLAPMHSVRLGQELAKFNLYWYEEPCLAGNIEALAEIRQRTTIPVVTGETLYTKSDFRPIFEKRAADIINPDVASCGGILELKEIAAMAETHLIGCAPHNYNSTLLALAATVQAAATMPNFILTEYFLPFVDFCDKVSPNQLKAKNSYIFVPTGPGLGVTVNEEALKEFVSQSYPARKLRYPSEEEV